MKDEYIASHVEFKPKILKERIEYSICDNVFTGSLDNVLKNIEELKAKHGENVSIEIEYVQHGKIFHLVEHRLETDKERTERVQKETKAAGKTFDAMVQNAVSNLLLGKKLNKNDKGLVQYVGNLRQY